MPYYFTTQLRTILIYIIMDASASLVNEKILILKDIVLTEALSEKIKEDGAIWELNLY